MKWQNWIGTDPLVSVGVLKSQLISLEQSIDSTIKLFFPPFVISLFWYKFRWQNWIDTDPM